MCGKGVAAQAKLAEKLVCPASESLGRMNVARVWLARQFSAAGRETSLSGIREFDNRL